MPVDPRLLRYASASRWFFLAIGAIALAQTAVVIAFAWLLTRAIVLAVTGAVDGMPAPDLTVTLGALAGVVVARAVLLWAREAIAARAAARVQTQLRAALISGVDALGPQWLDERSSAALALTAGRGLDALEAYFGRYLPQLVQTVVATPLIIATMWWQDWISGLTVILTIPLIPIFMVLIGYATRAAQQRQWSTLQRLATRFAETVQGLSTLKVFGRQHRAAASIESVTADYRRETMKVLRVSFLSGFALEFLASISVAIIAVSIGFRLIDGSLALGVGLFVLLLAPEAYLPLRQVGVQFHAAAEGVAATDDVFDVLDAARASRALCAEMTPDSAKLPPTRRDDPMSPPDPGSFRRKEGHLAEMGHGVVRVRDIRIRRGKRMLPPVDLVTSPGAITLIEGPSGAGKSSIFAALRGVASFDGTATFEGIDIRSLSPADWLAWAGQQPGLVSGSVFENIALADASPDTSLVARALSLACAEGLPPALNLGVQGAGISGGQAQRVAVARAFYRFLRGRAAVIALDEPSSALDPQTEARLWRNLRELADEGAAVLLISHRVSARAIADEIVRLDAIEMAR
jgi:ATP-binding cassette, subfamily C, bacterial CydD